MIFDIRLTHFIFNLYLILRYGWNHENGCFSQIKGLDSNITTTDLIKVKIKFNFALLFEIKKKTYIKICKFEWLLLLYTIVDKNQI